MAVFLNDHAELPSRLTLTDHNEDTEGTNRIAERIALQRRERQQRLFQKASDLRLFAEPDDVHPHCYVVRNPSKPYRCEIASADSCTCREFQLFSDCPHRALAVHMDRRTCKLRLVTNDGE